MSNFDEEITSDLGRLFAVAGRRSYLIGALHGGFPDLGHHLPGEMGGLWVPPIKVADGFWFGLSQQHDPKAQWEWEWMYGPSCRRFIMRPGYIKRQFVLELGGLSVQAAQRLFCPDQKRGLLIELSIHNASAQSARLILRWLVRWDVQGAWWSNWPDRPDQARFDPEWGGIMAWDGGHQEWSGAMLSAQPPDRAEVGSSIWGPEHTSSLLGEQGVPRGGLLPNPRELRGEGISGSLDYDLALQPGEHKTLRFALAGGTGGSGRARQEAKHLLTHSDELFAEKIDRQQQLISTASRIQTPQPRLGHVYSLQTLCMDMLTLEAPGVALGAVAGLPNFAWFFGCDTYYSVSGLLVSGQSQTALSTLRLLANYARRQGGRVPHEITQTGSIFNPGNPIETGQFVTAIERAYRWTGDRAFLEETYGVCKEGIFDYLLGTQAADGTFLPNGPGLLELRSAGRGKKLDVAAALHQGLRSLQYLAESVGDYETAARCAAAREKVREAIDEHFWIEERGEYLWRIEQDLTAWPEEPAHSYVMMEMGVLDANDPQNAARVSSLFEKVEGKKHTGPKGIIHPGTSDFVMPIQNAIVALAELQYSRPDRGLWYLERMADLCGQGAPWAIPEFEAEPGSGRACFLQLWSSAAYNWLMLQGWFRLWPDPDKRVVLVRPQLPSGWDEVRVENLELWGRRYDLSLRREGDDIHFSAVPLSGHEEHPFRVDPDPKLPVAFV